MRGAKWIRRSVGAAMAVVVTLLLALAIYAPFSLSGFAYLSGLVVVNCGLLWASKRVCGLGVAMLAAVLMTRLVIADGVSLAGERASLLSRLVDERDGTIPAAIFLVETGALPDDAVNFVDALRSSFTRYRDDAGVRGTPAIRTWLGLQSRRDFDLVEFAPRGETKSAVIFLHGYAGNFSVYCWQFAQAAREIDALVLCPSVGPSAIWHRSQGRAVVDKTLEIARARGATEIYLAGLSNGGVGASLLAPKYAPDTFAGLILISGVVANAPSPKTRTLLVHGVKDSMARVDSARVYAKAHGAHLVERPGGHMGFLDDWEGYQSAIAGFLTGNLRP